METNILKLFPWKTHILLNTQHHNRQHDLQSNRAVLEDHLGKNGKSIWAKYGKAEARIRTNI